MSSLKEHLASPQFTDQDGETTGDPVLKVGGTWVKHGVPRWKGYLFSAIAVIGGLALVLISVGLGDGIDLWALFGLIAVGLGTGTAIEVARGKPFTKIFGG